MTPHLSACRIEEFDDHIHITLHTVMTDDERGGSTGWIVGHADVEELRTQTFHHVEVKHGCRAVVLNVPCAELQSVRSFLQLGNTIKGGATGIGSEIVAEVVVERIGLRHVAIDDELKVVTYSAAGCIDAVLILDLCHKIRRAVHISTIDKRGRVEIAIDGRAYRIVLCLGTSSHNKLVAGAIGSNGLVGIQGIEIDHSLTIGIVDVLGHGKRQLETAVANAVGTMIESLGAV